MSSKYPKNGEYRIPRQNALVLSCIDLRLTDDLVHFLHHDNLHNRYDHFILAGTSLMCSEKRDLFLPTPYTNYSHHWRASFYDHLDIAIQLHDIKDVYLVEHQDCGAYKYFLKNPPDLCDEEGEKKLHENFAVELVRQIQSKKNDDGSPKYALNIHCFFIDLRGNVVLLKTFSHDCKGDLKDKG